MQQTEMIKYDIVVEHCYIKKNYLNEQMRLILQKYSIGCMQCLIFIADKTALNFLNYLQSESKLFHIISMFNH